MRTWDTRVGTIELAIPKVRPGTYFPSLLQPRRRAEHALLAVVQEAYVHGVSTRKVDDLMRALGLDGISKSEVSRICGELDTAVAAFRTPAADRRASLSLGRRDVPQGPRRRARASARRRWSPSGVTTEGDRQVLGLDVGPSEDRAFWTAFLRSLVKRGLTGVRLVISDAHEGLKQAIARSLAGTTWQRCRVHFMRNLLATVPQGAREAIAAIVRTIFAQPDHASAMAQLREGRRGLRAAVSAAADAARRRRRRHPGVPPPADRAPAATAQHQPAGAAQQGDQAALERRRHLPESGGGDPLGRRDPDRAGRRMGRGRTPLLQRGVDEAADDAGAVDHGAGDLWRRSRKRKTRGGRCGKPVRVFQAAVDGDLPSTAAAASTPMLTDGADRISTT